ncbi:MAG: hypothetical protein P9M06_03010, partial [Candidatus Saelkia tenebricola]|nr:hypothetical protein [Candidatus Saelkia tenebricola]
MNTLNKCLKAYLFHVLIFSLPVYNHSLPSLHANYLFRRTKTPDSTSLVSAETIEVILNKIESQWDIAKTGNIEVLKGMLVSEGILSIDTFDNYSSKWFELYLNTVLAEGSSLERVEVIRAAVLVVKTIIEVDDFLNLESSQDLIQCSGLLNLIQSLRRDLLRVNFDSLLDEEKEAILKKVATTLPYEERLLFYVAFQPKLLEKYLDVKQAAREEAEKLHAQEGGFSVDLLHPVPTVNMVLDSVNLSQLIPQHQLNTDVGIGSSSYQRRSEEIEKGIMAPLVILNLRGFGLAIYEGHARALAALDKEIETLPAYVITPRFPSLDRITNLAYARRITGLYTLEDMRFEELSLPEGVSLGELNVSNVITIEGDADELCSHMGTAVMENIIDSVREKGRANVLIGIKDLEFLRQSLNGRNFSQYIEDWSCVNIFFQIPVDMDSLESDDLVDQLCLIIPGNIPHENIHLANDLEELSEIVTREEGIDFVISDVASVGTDYTVAQTSVSEAKILLVVSNRSEGMLFQEMFFGGESQELLTSILNNPENILLTGSDFMRALLPREVRSYSEVISVQNLTQISEEIQPIISDIRLAVTQARGFNHPALIAVDGWAGAGRDTIIG